MNRRHLIFIVLLNAMISLVVALAVVWAVEARRPDPEVLAIPTTSAQPAVALPPAGATAAVEATAAPVDTPIQASDPNNTSTPSASAAEPTATLDPANQQIYTIQAGDSLSAVADRFGTTLDAIVKVNELSDPNVVYVGQRLIIPVGSNGEPNTASPQTLTPTDTLPLAVGQGILIRAVDGAGALVTEAVQIVNDSNAAVNLNGWRLERVDGPSYAFGSTLSIFPGGNIWLHTTSGDDTSVALYWDQPEPVWQSGSVARLLDAQGNVIHTYTVP